jgi:hypothetical protein
MGETRDGETKEGVAEGERGEEGRARDLKHCKGLERFKRCRGVIECKLVLQFVCVSY